MVKVIRLASFSTTLVVCLLVLVSSGTAGVAPAGESSGMERDGAMRGKLETLVHRLNLDGAVERKKFAVSLVDVTDAEHPRYAGVNDTVMMYAASLPKIAILLAGFEQVRQGALSYTPEVREMFNRIARFSSNTDASKAVRMIGFDKIAATLTSSKYKLYDPAQNGGLWVGKAYGGPNDYWKPDPLHHLSHGATTLQTARFFTLLAQDKLVDVEMSRELKQVLGHPGIHHKFVKGLDAVPGVTIYRKSGTWQNWHADGALIEYNGKRYVAAALFEDAQGGKLLEKLIVGLHAIICGQAQSNAD